MAKTKARKTREHMLRNSGKDVTLSRGGSDFSTHVRKTKTNDERLMRTENKYKKQFGRGDQPDGIAFLFVNLCNQAV